jgi:hypothetical protein
VESEKIKVKSPEIMQSGEKKKRRMCHTLALPFTLKGILRQKKNYGSSNISPCKTKIFKKSSKRNQNPSR